MLRVEISESDLEELTKEVRGAASCETIWLIRGHNGILVEITSGNGYRAESLSDFLAKKGARIEEKWSGYL